MWFLDLIQKQLQKAYELGESLTIDESMIKYVGRAISWTQYMPGLLNVTSRGVGGAVI